MPELIRRARPCCPPQCEDVLALAVRKDGARAGSHHSTGAENPKDGVDELAVASVRATDRLCGRTCSADGGWTSEQRVKVSVYFCANVVLTNSSRPFYHRGGIRHVSCHHAL